MTRLALSIATVAALSMVAGPGLRGAGQANSSRVEVKPVPAERRVDVLVDGKPFTAYLYGTTSKKPILYPIRSARGTVVTRGYPLEPRPGERADHPHQTGHWFNHGEVNGYDFWGHSDATPADRRSKAGTIVHKAVTRSAGGNGDGTLAVTADWMLPDGSVVLAETTTFAFHARADWRAIDRETTWTAVNGPVVFGDTKEGSFGIRVARTLEHPSDQPERFVGPGGTIDEKRRVDATKVTGSYLGSDLTRGEAVWGKSGPWMALIGTVDGETVTLAIFDHPQNPGHPTRWHARGYGLLAANPFGRQGFDPKLPLTPTTLDAKKSWLFRHRILVQSGAATREQLQQEYDRFVAGQS
jgi:hypothetical protein